jgi:hypothetical protein
MSTSRVLEREEYVEQAYFFRILRERLAANVAIQEVLGSLDQEILSSTRLPFAVQFVAAEVKHSGLLSSGFTRLSHYFTPFQALVIRGTEDERNRFNIETALTVLEREAQYRASAVSPAGLFVYQFEVLARNRLGYRDGLQSMQGDPLYPQEWRDFLEMVRDAIGVVDFADLIYLRSELYVQEQRRIDPEYVPPLPALLGEKEGKIARANLGKDPLYLFAALQRQLGYPEVPRPRPRDDMGTRVETLQTRIRDLEQRLRLVEGEVKGKLDLESLGRPEILRDDAPEIDI